MAEANYDAFVAGPTRGARMAKLVNIAGALTTVAVVVSVSVWAYRLAVRDAHGVPVIQAMQGPIRIAPEDPGGKVAAHVGLSVNRIAADGTAGEVPDRILLAEPPIDLESDDAPGIGAAAPRAVSEAESMARTLALADELARQVAAETAPAPESGETLAADAAAVTQGVVQRTVRPMPRPARGDALIAASLSNTTTLSAPATVGPAEVAPESLPPGTRLAQIGAYDDAETARREWDRAATRHAALFEGKARVIQPATSVGRTFYRLRVQGFATEDDSRRFCSAIESGDLRCIPVTTR
ncbi:MAG: SPOR domain-containing protein [Gemmobacter sp.]|nr:SPOR domain-containing protein [Gemmobacter sp.]